MAVRVQRRIEVDAATCYAAFCDVQRIPEWVEPVAAVAIETLDSNDKPEEVWFEASDGEASPLRYTLHYTYDPSRCRVLWRPGRNADAALHGVATFEPVQGELACTLTYTIKLGDERESTRAAAQAQASAVVEAFTAWMSERSR